MHGYTVSHFFIDGSGGDDRVCGIRCHRGDPTEDGPFWGLCVGGLYSGWWRYDAGCDPWTDSGGFKRSEVCGRGCSRIAACVSDLLF